MDTTKRESAQVVRRDGVPRRGDEVGARWATEEQRLRLPTTQWKLRGRGLLQERTERTEYSGNR